MNDDELDKSVAKIQEDLSSLKDYLNISQTYNNSQLNFSNISRDNAQNGNIICEDSQITPFPKFSEIQRSIQILKRAIPEFFTNQTINQLYSKLIFRAKNKQSNANYDKISNDQPQSINQNVIKQIKKKSEGDTIRSKFEQLIKNRLPDKRFCPEFGFFDKDFMPQAIIQNISTVQIFKQHKQKNNTLKFNNDLQFESKNKLHGLKQMKFQSKTQKKLTINKQLEKIWTLQMQEIFFDDYKKNKNFAEMSENLRYRFPRYRYQMSYQTLRHHFYKLIRRAIRKLKDYCQLFEGRVPKMIKINQFISKKIISAKEARLVRISLIEMYHSSKKQQINDINISKVDSTINLVNDLVKQFYPYANEQFYPQMIQ